MLGKRTRPRPADITKPGARFNFPETLTSPKCCLEYRILSPRSLKASDKVASGIGLGIVAALEKEKPSPPIKTPVVCGSNPITISSHKNTDEMESYTYVTSRRPEKQFNKVYCDEGEVGGAGHDRTSGCEDMTWRNSGVFYESPPARFTEGSFAFPVLDFLSSCHLCRKNLHGADIYMYRGEKAFCSTECRCKQIVADERIERCLSEVADERNEKCGSEVSRSFDVSSSPYTRENIFFTGIIAA